MNSNRVTEEEVKEVVSILTRSETIPNLFLNYPSYITLIIEKIEQRRTYGE